MLEMASDNFMGKLGSRNECYVLAWLRFEMERKMRFEMRKSGVQRA